MIDHIALIVSNVKKIKEILENIGKFNWHNEIVMEQEVEVLFIDGNPRIEFISPLKANSPISKYLLKKGEYAFHHIAIKTKNIEFKALEKEGKGDLYLILETLTSLFFLLKSYYIFEKLLKELLKQ